MYEITSNLLSKNLVLLNNSKRNQILLIIITIKTESWRKVTIIVLRTSIIIIKKNTSLHVYFTFALSLTLFHSLLNLTAPDESINIGNAKPVTESYIFNFCFKWGPAGPCVWFLNLVYFCVIFFFLAI